MDDHGQEAGVKAPHEEEDIRVVGVGEGNGGDFAVPEGREYDTNIGETKNGALRPPIPDCDGDGGSVTSESERRRGVNT